MGRKVRLSQERIEYRIADWKRNTSPFSGSEGRKRPHFAFCSFRAHVISEIRWNSHAGRRCHKEGTSPRWRNPNCWSRTCEPSSVHSACSTRACSSFCVASKLDTKALKFTLLY